MMCSNRKMRVAAKKHISSVIALSMVLNSLFLLGLASPRAAYALTVEQARQSSQRIAAGGYHSVGLRPDTAVAAWGANGQGECDVPPGSQSAIAVAAGFDYSLAVQADGTVHVWGSMSEVPSDLDGVVAVSAGVAHSLALKSEGTVVAWGSNTNGQTDVPAGLDNVVAVAAGDWHSLALKSDGTVVAWGSNFAGQCSVPTGLNSAVGIAAGGLHSLALKADGTVVAWGRTAEQQCAVPAGLSNVVSVAAGLRHSLALKSDGKVIAWGGRTADGVTDRSVSVPASLAEVVAIDGGDRHSLALRSDGTFVGWGENGAGQSFGVDFVDPPDGASSVQTDKSITVKLSASATAGASYGQIVLRDKNGTLIGTTKTLSGDTLVVKPNAPLNTDNRYTLTLPDGSIVDARALGIPLFTYTFFTADTKPPTVVSVDPINGAASAPLDVIVRVYFNETIRPGTLLDSTVLKDSDGAAVECVSGVTGNYIWVRPKAHLEFDVRYTLTVAGGAVEDLAGNASASNFMSWFRTGEPLPPVLNVVGSNRIETAIKASQLAFERADTVVIATGRNWPDALGGTSLAGAVDGPILLVDGAKKAVPVAVTNEIGRLKASNVIIVGGTAAVSADIERALKGSKLSVTRIAGSNRYATANLIAKRVIARQGTSYSGKAFVVTGGNFPDALAAAPLASAGKWPLYLADPAKGITPETKAAMAGVKEVVITGGAAVVSAKVESGLKASYPNKVTRVAGANRYDTAARVAAYGVKSSGLGLKWDRVGITTGDDFPDALAGGVVQGNVGSVMLLTRSDILDAAAAGALKANTAGISTVTYFGGTSAVSDKVRDQVSAALSM